MDKRLLKDVVNIIKNPLTEHGIYYSHDDTDMTKGYAMIVGPEDTPYFGGYYFFKLTYPSDYPFSPPNVTYLTNNGITRFNPNLYKCGKVCLSILNTWNGDKWSSCQTISSTLLAIASLLNNNPLLNEPLITATGIMNDDPRCNIYSQSIQYVNIDFAVCDMIRNPLFSTFHSYMLEHFRKNYDKLLKIVVDNDDGNNHKYYVEVYNMKTTTNYGELKHKLISTYNDFLNK